MFPNGASRALLAVAAGSAVAQFTNWQEDQISTEICTWEQPRAALLRDMIYLDGGTIKWTPRFRDGKIGTPVDNGNNKGVILNYNLSTPFDSDTNVTGILLKDNLSKARGGAGNSNGAAPNFIDGGMLANNDEFFLYGGIYLSVTELYDAPDADAVIGYQAYQYGPDKPLWEKGFTDTDLDNDVTRYVAYGAAVNAPSENKAWYFSGLRSPVFGDIVDNPLNDTTKAVNVSDTLIVLNMAEQLSETWTNKTLPGSIEGRSNAEVVWVPVGKEGILVVLGGVVYPEWAGTSAKSANQSASEEESPKFMSTIDIYDIANDKWYQQPTEDGPGARARGCAVVAAASDYSSFNIFYYGGFDGINVKEHFSDDVWALSLPSFTWTKINEGTSLHGRAGHKCFTPYADQMMILGGYTPQAGTSITCLDGGPVVLFNISSGEWMDSYDPSKYADYGVHEKIQSKIGGDAAGGATATKPSPDGWATSALASVFDTSYDKEKITTYYPYASATSTDRPVITNTPNDDDNGGGGGSSLPKWVAPVLGVVLGLMLVTGILVLFCLYRRRKIFRNRSSDAGTEDAGMRIISWMRGQPTEKAPTVTTSDDTPTSPDLEEARIVGARPAHPVPTTPAPVEMADTHIAELADTSPLVELHDTGLSPVDIIQKHTHFAKPQSTSLTDPSYSSYSMGQDRASTVSRSSAAAHNSIISSTGPDDVSARVTSDLSGISEVDAANLRRLSSGPVSPRSDLTPAEDDKAVGDLVPSPASPTPVSPPTAGESSGQDYLTAKPAVSPLRKSVFLESEEDMGKAK
ncbi:hypothetical protein EDB81DRAFT_879293 [Dactylonectria macrodidyma]|uniref:Kelch repeat-containing protein n=1 Tax=Dactylonectria macrodidyma TaxID=307937 RepID=A0A9P9FH28_9HYPO|nr:hypothetical protein EDB81DRAFT_879293 [Dactylonectria macrodidyma]